MEKKEYEAALDYCADDLTSHLILEDITAVINNWEAFCADLRAKFEEAQKALQEAADEAEALEDEDE